MPDLPEQRFVVGTTVLVVKKGDLTDETTDAIVNAANPSLLGGGGVDGSIHRRGGRRILEECMQIGGCSPGEAVITTGGDLPARYVIHTVGPVWHGGGRREDDVLRQAYENCLALARKRGLSTVAFPSISTGAYGFPVDRAACIALSAIRSFCLRDPRLAEIRLVLFSNDGYEAYAAAARDAIAP